MLRFIPDDWLQGLLRPFVLADPLGGVYFEDPAPDLRFAAFIVLLLIGLATRCRVPGWTSAQGLLAFGLGINLYVWTAVTGNGRYFVWGLLLIGPIVIAAALRLSGSPVRRWAAVAGVFILQGLVLHDFYDRNRWGMVAWGDGPVPIAASALRQTPAVFLTASAISYSILVPWFHPQSRWSNISGQRQIAIGDLEYPRLQELLSSPLPKYIVVASVAGADAPRGELREMLQLVLARYGFGLSNAACPLIKTTLSAEFQKSEEGARPGRGFWICPVERSALPVEQIKGSALLHDRMADVFDRIERTCPRFFPPGKGKRIVLDGGAVMRHYTDSDMRLYLDKDGLVMYRYFRALTPTLVGSGSDVLAGHFHVDCDNIAGRYRLPWQRD